MEAVAIDVTTSVSAIAENGDIKYGMAVTRGSEDASGGIPGYIQACDATDIMLGIADDDTRPKQTEDYWDRFNVVRVLQSGCRCMGWLASGNALTRGHFLKLAGSGFFEPETSGTRTATSVAQAMESKSSSASAQQIELIIL